MSLSLGIGLGLTDVTVRGTGGADVNPSLLTSTLVIDDDGECPTDLTPVDFTEVWRNVAGQGIAGLTPVFGD